MRGPAVRPAARAFPGVSRRPQGKVTGQPHHRVPRAMSPVWRFVSRQPHLVAFEKEASKCPPARVSQGSSDDVSCREMARLSKSREEHHAWSGRYAAEAHDSPLRTERTEREHVASWFGVNPTTGSGAHSRQLGNNSAKVCHDRPRSAASLLWVAEVVDAGGEAVGRCSRRRSPWRPARGLPGRGGGDPLGYGELAPPRAEPPFARRVLGAHSDIGGGRSPQAVREQGLPLCLVGWAA